MELGGGLPLSEDNGVRGFPGLDFQSGCIPFPCNIGIKTASSSKTQVVDAPLAPVTPEKTITKENVLDSSGSKPIGQCTPIEHCMKEWVHPHKQHDGATPSNVPSADTKDEPSTEQQNSKFQVDDSQQSLTEILVKGSIGTEKAHSDGVDLNRTPPQKPKRKKVRPKVVKEGKPRRSPNKEQASQRQEGTPVQGRHTTTGRRKRKDATTTTLDVEESVCLPNAARVASCRRSLNFDSNVEACNDKFGSIRQHAVERGRPTAGNPSEPAVVDVNGSLNNIVDSHLCLSQNSSPPLLKRKASSRWNAKNMARKKNNVDNGYRRETHQVHFVTSHESADMPRCGLQNLYDTGQQDDTIISTESQSSIQTSTTISTGLVQVQLHTKGGPCSMDLQEQQNRHIQTSSNLRPHPFKESFTDRETEASPQEQQSYVMSSTSTQKGSAWEVGSVTTETSKKVVISRLGRQKATEPSNHVHKETSLKQCEKQQSLITQCHPGEKYFNFQNVQEGNDMLVKVQVKAKRSPRKAPIHAHHPRTFFAINHGFMPQNSTQEREDDIACGPQTCQEALLLDRLAQRITKKRRRKGISHAVKFTSFPTVDRPENCTHQGQESHGVLSSDLVNKQETMTIRATHSVHDCGSSSNLKENLTPMFSSEVISFMKPIDEIVNRLRSLHIRERDVNAAAVPQNAIVPYSAAGTIVPYAVTFKPLRKRRPRPKVDLDEETNIAWKLLMGIESAGIDGTDADKERWWGEERRVFRGRADSFIARMHLIQGQDSSGSNSNKHFQSIVDSNIPPTASEEENLLCFSIISSQNLTDCTTQAVNQIGSSPECVTPADEFMNRYKNGCFEWRSFSELLCMAESSMFKGLYANMSHCGSHGEQVRNTSDKLQYAICKKISLRQFQLIPNGHHHSLIEKKLNNQSGNLLKMDGDIEKQTPRMVVSGGGF